MTPSARFDSHQSCIPLIPLPRLSLCLPITLTSLLSGLPQSVHSISHIAHECLLPGSRPPQTLSRILWKWVSLTSRLSAFLSNTFHNSI
ncbi:hypothetical protein MRB53_029759 [Persea americana]|uniref:Uncharacterized protein n=1 Tax=Persea americana TaxID=3435 RepID=A0ACC2KJ72_PERAE|nr:hypothetical protein MRB53_029759 [Persea americana]